MSNAIECNWILVDINLNKIYQEVFSIKSMHSLKKVFLNQSFSYDNKIYYLRN
ncbi:hypothetical protein YSS_04610 [Campylobacter coli RM4661]|nr:hypothetical protein YSS_04610 [Campylobacter coli RM4661]